MKLSRTLHLAYISYPQYQELLGGSLRMSVLGIDTNIVMADFSCSPSYLPILDFVNAFTLTRLGMVCFSFATPTLGTFTEFETC